MPFLILPCWNGLFSWPVVILWSRFRIIPCDSWVLLTFYCLLDFVCKAFYKQSMVQSEVGKTKKYWQCQRSGQSTRSSDKIQLGPLTAAEHWLLVYKIVNISLFPNNIKFSTALPMTTKNTHAKCEAVKRNSSQEMCYTHRQNNRQTFGELVGRLWHQANRSNMWLSYLIEDYYLVHRTGTAHTGGTDVLAEAGWDGF